MFSCHSFEATEQKTYNYSKSAILFRSLLCYWLPCGHLASFKSRWRTTRKEEIIQEFYFKIDFAIVSKAFALMITHFNRVFPPLSIVYLRYNKTPDDLFEFSTPLTADDASDRRLHKLFIDIHIFTTYFLKTPYCLPTYLPTPFLIIY